MRLRAVSVDLCRLDLAHEDSQRKIKRRKDDIRWNYAGKKKERRETRRVGNARG